MRHHFRFPIIVLLIAVIFTFTACGGTAGGATSAPTESVSIQFSWIDTIEFAGFYMAEDLGYYAEEGLNAELLTGGYDADGNYIDPVEAVASGKANFGDTDAGVFLQARANGMPLVAIASIYQRHPLAFTSLASKNIAHPQDLIGKTVDVSDNTLVVYYALLASQGIDPAQVNMRARTDFTINPLVNGDVDVIDAWITNEVVELKMAGYEVNTILVSDYGIDMYPDVIFTSEDMITNHPDLVEKFLRATLRGTQKAIEDPDHAAELSVSRNDTLNLDKEKLSMQQSLPLLNPPGSQPGMMTDEVWQTTQQILLDQSILSQPLDLSKAYTLEFLNKIYGQ